MNYLELEQEAKRVQVCEHLNNFERRQFPTVLASFLPYISGYPYIAPVPIQHIAQKLGIKLTQADKIAQCLEIASVFCPSFNAEQKIQFIDNFLVPLHLLEPAVVYGSVIIEKRSWFLPDKKRCYTLNELANKFKAPVAMIKKQLEYLR